MITLSEGLRLGRACGVSRAWPSALFCAKIEPGCCSELVDSFSTGKLWFRRSGARGVLEADVHLPVTKDHTFRLRGPVRTRGLVRLPHAT